MSNQPKKLVVFGDSWVQGYRSLPEPMVNTRNVCHYFSEFIDGIVVENQGLRASSNVDIANTVFRYVKNNDTKNCVFLVCFSEWSRLTIVEKYDKTKELGIFLPHSFNPKLSVEIKEKVNINFLRYCTESSYFSVLSLCESMNIPVRFTNSICDQHMHEYKFNPKFGEHVRIPFLPMEKNWIEPHTNYNTMYDILTGDWLKSRDNVSIFMRRTKKCKENDHDTDYFTECLHPTSYGSKIIAQTLTPYIQEIL